MTNNNVTRLMNNMNTFCEVFTKGYAKKTFLRVIKGYAKKTPLNIT